MADGSSTVALALSLRGSEAALLAMALEKNTPDETGQERVYDAIKMGSAAASPQGDTCSIGVAYGKVAQ